MLQHYWPQRWLGQQLPSLLLLSPCGDQLHNQSLPRQLRGDLRRARPLRRRQHLQYILLPSRRPRLKPTMQGRPKQKVEFSYELPRLTSPWLGHNFCSGREHGALRVNDVFTRNKSANG